MSLCRADTEPLGPRGQFAAAFRPSGIRTLANWLSQASRLPMIRQPGAQPLRFPAAPLIERTSRLCFSVTRIVSAGRAIDARLRELPASQGCAIGIGPTVSFCEPVHVQ